MRKRRRKKGRPRVEDETPLVVQAVSTVATIFLLFFCVVDVARIMIMPATSRGQLLLLPTFFCRALEDFDITLPDFGNDDNLGSWGDVVGNDNEVDLSNMDAEQKVAFEDALNEYMHPDVEQSDVQEWMDHVGDGDGHDFAEDYNEALVEHQKEADTNFIHNLADNHAPAGRFSWGDLSDMANDDGAPGHVSEKEWVEKGGDPDVFHLMAGPDHELTETDFERHGPINMLDGSNDKFSPDEFVAASFKAHLMGQVGHHDTLSSNDLAGMYDTDGDGKLSLDEWKAGGGDSDDFHDIADFRKGHAGSPAFMTGVDIAEGNLDGEPGLNRDEVALGHLAREFGSDDKITLGDLNTMDEDGDGKIGEREWQENGLPRDVFKAISGGHHQAEEGLGNVLGKQEFRDAFGTDGLSKDDMKDLMHPDNGHDQDDLFKMGGGKSSDTVISWFDWNKMDTEHGKQNVVTWEEAQAGGIDRGTFNQYAGADGRVTPQDLENLNMGGDENMIGHEEQEVMNAMDLDNRLSYEEAKNHDPNLLVDQSHGDGKHDLLVRALDEDNNGEVSREEFYAADTSSHEQGAAGTSEHGQAGDVTGKDGLSTQEIRRAMHDHPHVPDSDSPDTPATTDPNPLGPTTEPPTDPEAPTGADKNKVVRSEVFSGVVGAGLVGGAAHLVHRHRRKKKEQEENDRKHKKHKHHHKSKSKEDQDHATSSSSFVEEKRDLHEGAPALLADPETTVNEMVEARYNDVSESWYSSDMQEEDISSADNAGADAASSTSPSSAEEIDSAAEMEEEREGGSGATTSRSFYSGTSSNAFASSFLEQEGELHQPAAKLQSSHQESSNQDEEVEVLAGRAKRMKNPKTGRDDQEEQQKLHHIELQDQERASSTNSYDSAKSTTAPSVKRGNLRGTASSSKSTSSGGAGSTTSSTNAAAVGDAAAAGGDEVDSSSTTTTKISSRSIFNWMDFDPFSFPFDFEFLPSFHLPAAFSETLNNLQLRFSTSSVGQGAEQVESQAGEGTSRISSSTKGAGTIKTRTTSSSTQAIQPGPVDSFLFLFAASTAGPQQHLPLFVVLLLVVWLLLRYIFFRRSWSLFSSSLWQQRAPAGGNSASASRAEGSSICPSQATRATSSASTSETAVDVAHQDHMNRKKLQGNDSSCPTSTRENKQNESEKTCGICCSWCCSRNKKPFELREPVWV
ncbi:unnamed protein product [Amoebophrya sp. A120]|nr:unnamed protein product [Amoebophrya sp. A120]|eukprot:GSA120T00021110001.1